MPVIFLLDTDSYKLKVKFGSEMASSGMTFFHENWHVNTEALGFCDRASWANCEERERETNKMQQSDVYYQLLSQHVSGIIMPIIRRTKIAAQHPTPATNHIQQKQRSTPYAVTYDLCSPDEGHNDARNMLRQVDNKHLIVASCWFFLLSRSSHKLYSFTSDTSLVHPNDR